MKLLQRYLCGFGFVLLLTLFCFGQERIRQIEKKNTRNEPIELINSEVGNKVSNTENQVLADKDWLRNLKLNLKNISNKRIVYIEVELEIEPVGKMQHPLRLPIKFGKLPSLTNINDANSEVIRQNEYIKVSLKPYILDSLVQFMQKNEIAEIERVKVFFEFVVFDDGTAWSKGQQMRRNPTNGNQWDVIGNSQKEISILQNNSIFDPALISNWRENRIAFYELV